MLQYWQKYIRGHPLTHPYPGTWRHLWGTWGSPQKLVRWKYVIYKSCRVCFSNEKISLLGYFWTPGVFAGRGLGYFLITNIQSGFGLRIAFGWGPKIPKSWLCNIWIVPKGSDLLFLWMHWNWFFPTQVVWQPVSSEPSLQSLMPLHICIWSTHSKGKRLPKLDWIFRRRGALGLLLVVSQYCIFVLL